MKSIFKRQWAAHSKRSPAASGIQTFKSFWCSFVPIRDPRIFYRDSHRLRKSCDDSRNHWRLQCRKDVHCFFSFASRDAFVKYPIHWRKSWPYPAKKGLKLKRERGCSQYYTWPGGAPFNNRMGLYLVDTLSRGEWAEGRIETAARVMVTRAIAEMKSLSSIVIKIQLKNQ